MPPVAVTPLNWQRSLSFFTRQTDAGSRIPRPKVFSCKLRVIQYDGDS